MIDQGVDIYQVVRKCLSIFLSLIWSSISRRISFSIVITLCLIRIIIFFFTNRWGISSRICFASRLSFIPYRDLTLLGFSNERSTPLCALLILLFDWANESYSLLRLRCYLLSIQRTIRNKTYWMTFSS